MNDTSNTEGGGAPPAIDPTRRVFRVPVDLRLRVDMYILSTSLDEAIAKAVNLSTEEIDDLVAHDEENLWVNDENLCQIAYVVPGVVVSDEASEHGGYDPKGHPDWSGILKA